MARTRVSHEVCVHALEPGDDPGAHRDPPSVLANVSELDDHAVAGRRSAPPTAASVVNRPRKEGYR